MSAADFNLLFLSTVVFVGGHFALSAQPLRGLVTGALGDSGFRILYSLVAAAAIFFMVSSYNDAPYAQLWQLPAWSAWIPVTLLPIAYVFAVAGLTTRSPTVVGGEAQAREMDPAPGIIRVTRHPFLWGVTLWALSHVAVNGDFASVIFFAGFAVLSLGGMLHIDHRREKALGGDWGPIKLTTSLVPFWALLTGRTSMDWKGLSWWRPALGLGLYLGTMVAHEAVIGVPVPIH